MYTGNKLRPQADYRDAKGRRAARHNACVLKCKQTNGKGTDVKCNIQTEQ